jgi:2-phosphosulfolactate phosphatase
LIFNQQDFDIRLEWGRKGVEILAPVSDVVIIVDVLSFSTSVDIAVNNGANIYPFDPKNNSALEYSKSVNGILALKSRKDRTGFSLSPSSLINIPRDTRLILSSPNGSALSLLTKNTFTLCGCIRNAKSVADYAMSKGKRIAVIPGGERWTDDDTLRPSFEDLTGAGAIINYLKGTLSPESKSALTVFLSCRNNLRDEIKNCISGKEKISAGLESDVDLACELNVSECVPALVNRAYIDVSNQMKKIFK